MHSLLEGHINSLIQAEYGPDAPFWRTSMVQAISEFRVIIPSPRNPPFGEEEKRRINAYLDRAYNFSERVERIIPPPVSHYETMLYRLPHNIDPWPLSKIKPSPEGHPTYGETSRNPWPEGYRSLAQVLGPIEELLF